VIKSNDFAGVDFDVPEIVRVKFADLIANIQILIWDRLSFGWVKGFERLQMFVKQHHHARVPKSHTDTKDQFPLGAWVSKRRSEYTQGKLASARIRDLESVPGWVWDPFEADYQAALTKLRAYVKQHHHARVPQRHTDTKDKLPLGAWVSSRRIEYNHGRLAPAHIRDLESVRGWVWKVDKMGSENGPTKKLAAQRWKEATVMRVLE